MSIDELIARSISRETFECCGNELTPEGIALSTLDILNGLKNNNDDSRRIYDNAFHNYKKYSEHIFIYSSQSYVSKTYNTNYCEYESVNTTKGIRLALEQHIRIMKKTPVVMVDYLQLLNIRSTTSLTDKQLVDKNIVELKNISTDFHTPVITISSLNRASYNSKDIDFSVFKESGSIEHNGDILIGLQFQDKSDPNEAKQKEPRDIEAVILKQRNAPVGTKINFLFHAKYNCFEEAE